MSKLFKSLAKRMFYHKVKLTTALLHSHRITWFQNIHNYILLLKTYAALFWRRQLH